MNWNDYRASFEAEAEKVLGRPVHVLGSTSASILPSPSLTFENVQVGEEGGAPMMQIDRFSVTIELMPLLQGEFRVVSMRIERPEIRVAVGEDGRINWQARNEASRALDPDKVVLEDVEIVDGRISYSDSVAGKAFDLDAVNARIGARSLLGPWRVEGTYLDKGAAVPFLFTTGRRLDDGTLRVKADISPAEWPVALATDGALGSDEKGFFYDGTYSVAEIVLATAEEETQPTGDASGWRSTGKFRLTRGNLDLPEATLSIGAGAQPFSVTGSAAVDLGRQPHFETHVSARQVDLDRMLGSGPSEPVSVGGAMEKMVGSLRNSYLPPIPGTVFFTVPTVVVGGSIIQSIDVEARSTIGGWRLARLAADLPGRGRLSARGVLATDYEVSFAGDVELDVGQPATFATWWRGRGEEGAGRLLDAFRLSGRAEIDREHVLLEDLRATVGAAAVSGRLAWRDTDIRERQRALEATLTADRLDVAQLRSIAELLVGKDLANPAALADVYDLDLKADELRYDDISVKDVAVDASLTESALTVDAFSIGNLGGASLDVTQGRLDWSDGAPKGRIDAQLDAETLDGFVRLVGKIAPGNSFVDWLNRAGSRLAPAFLTASIEAPAEVGGSGFRVQLNGTAAETTLSSNFHIAGDPSAWRENTIEAEIVLDTPDAQQLARQAGIAVADVFNVGGGSLRITASGIPAQGMETRIAGDYAGIGVRAEGDFAIGVENKPTMSGTLALAGDSIAPVLSLAGLDIPGVDRQTAARLDGNATWDGKALSFDWRNGRIGDRRIGGHVTLAGGAGDLIQFDGDLHADLVDLGWVTALGLETPIRPFAEGEEAWSREPFGDSRIAGLRGRIGLEADEFVIADRMRASHASLALTLQQDRLRAEMTSGQILGGAMTGNLSIANVGGNANFTGTFAIKDASLESVAWQRSGRAVATGKLDLSAEFEAAGRSPAAAIAALTGTGTVEVRDGEARYVNPQAAQLVIRASDLGQEFTEAALRDAFTEQIDAGSLKFARADGAFSIAAGTARLTSVAVADETLRPTGSAVIDLNKLTLDSDWTLTFPPGDDKVEGVIPQVGIVFRGPIATPERIIDVVQFNSYLNIRQETRLLEILSQAEADRLERDRLNRERRKLREDAERRDRKAREAAEAARRAAEEAARRAAIEAARKAGMEMAGLIGAPAATGAAAEVARLAEVERERVRREEEARKAAEEAERVAAEQARREAEEKARLEAEAARIAAETARREAEEKVRREAEEVRLAEEAARRAQARREELARLRTVIMATARDIGTKGASAAVTAIVQSQPPRMEAPPQASPGRTEVPPLRLIQPPNFDMPLEEMVPN